MNQDNLKAFAELLEREQFESLKKEYPKLDPEFERKVTIVPGRKYTKVNVGTSGKYMVDKDGNIWGIKGYGIVHHGHRYGNLDTINNWYWGGYTATKKASSLAN